MAQERVRALVRRREPDLDTGAQPSRKRQKQEDPEGEPEDVAATRSNTSSSKEAKSNHSAENGERVDEGRGEQKAIISSHIRFGSEENELSAPTLKESETQPRTTEDPFSQKTSDNGDSENEAPESFSKSEAQSHVKSTLAEAAKGVEKQRSRVKQRRKERDARLKQQSEQSTRKSRESKDLKIGDSVALPTKKLPRFLPEEILADESFDRRPPTPEQDIQEEVEVSAATAASKKKSRLSSRPTRNLRVGSVNVRVLEKENRFLAPKSNRSSRSLKENWLVGRQRRGFERSKVNGKFVKA